MARKEQQLIEMVKPVVESLGLQFWGLEYASQGNKPLVRIYIESNQGVDVEDCAKVSRQVSSLFDVEDPILGEYTLEVSSPGIERPVFNLDQYRLYIGEPIKVKLSRAFEGRRNFTGQLAGIENDEIVIAIDDEEYLISHDMVDKAVVSLPLEKNKIK